VLESGRLGDLWRVHSRFDLDQPDQLEAGPDGGLPRDPGTHVIAQLLWLLGPVEAGPPPIGHLDPREGRTPAPLLATLHHASAVTSYASSTKLNHLHRRTLRAYGSAGSYEAASTDVQADAIFSGHRPAKDRDGWGYEAREHWGTLHTADGDEAVPSAQGAYFEFYEQLAAACAGRGEAASPASEGVAVLEVLDAARQAAQNWRPVTIG